MTGFSKTKHSKYNRIRNYQVSHIFGRTKNVFAFTAPWNIAYTPKLLDPFTGHEANGSMVKEFTTLFQKQAHVRFEKLIDDFNEIVSGQDFLDRIASCTQELKGYTSEDIQKLEKAIAENFKPIELNPS